MKNKYNYPTLERITMDVGRYYLDSTNNPVPSVTTVLSATSSSSEGISRWRIKVGEEEADRIIKQSTDIGTAVHEAIERFLNNEEWDLFDNTEDQGIAKNITNKFIDVGLSGISEIWGLEVGLLLDNFYAGTADCVGLYKNIPTLIDFKTAKKIKRRDWIEDYFLQGCAYAKAHNVTFGTDIEQIVILMVDRDMVFEEFIVKPVEFKHLTRKWKNRLIQFNKYNT